MAHVTWRSVPADEFVPICWDGTHIVYHRASGLTHVLNRAMFYLLDVILGAPKDLDAAIDGLSRLSEDRASSLTREQMIDLMLRLEQLGLVRRE